MIINTYFSVYNHIKALIQGYNRYIVVVLFLLLMIYISSFIKITKTTEIILTITISLNCFVISVCVWVCVCVHLIEKLHLFKIKTLIFKIKKKCDKKKNEQKSLEKISGTVFNGSNFIYFK